MSYKDPENRKAFARKNYRENKQYYVDKAARLRKELHQLVADLKTDVPCADCKIVYPHYVMQFDHLPGAEKISDICKLISKGSKKKILAEIDKCEIVCANCHFIRTWTRSHP